MKLITIIIVFVFFAAVFTRLLAAAGLGSLYLRKRKLRKLVDIDRLLAARIDAPVTIAIILHRYGAIAGEVVDRALKLHAHRKQVLLLYDGDETGREQLIQKYGLKRRFNVVRREIAAPVEKEFLFSSQHPELEFVVFDEKIKTAELLNSALNMARYPYFLPLFDNMFILPNALLALTRPMATSAETSDFITAPLFCSTDEIGHRGFDVRSLLFFSLLSGAIPNEAVYLFKKSSLVTAGGFQKDSSTPIADMQRFLKTPLADQHNLIVDTLAFYARDDRKTIAADAKNEISLFKSLAKGNHVVYSKSSISLFAALWLARLVLYPLVVAIAIIGASFSEFATQAQLLATLIMTDLMVEASMQIIASLLAQSAKERIFKIIVQAAGTWCSFPMRIFFPMLGKAKE